MKRIQYKAKIHFKSTGVYTTSFTFAEQKKRPKITNHYTVNIQTSVETDTGFDCVLIFDPVAKQLYFDDKRATIIKNDVQLFQESYAKKKGKKANKETNAGI